MQLLTVSSHTISSSGKFSTFQLLLVEIHGLVGLSSVMRASLLIPSTGSETTGLCTTFQAAGGFHAISRSTFAYALCVCDYSAHFKRIPLILFMYCACLLKSCAPRAWLCVMPLTYYGGPFSAWVHVTQHVWVRLVWVDRNSHACLDGSAQSGKRVCVRNVTRRRVSGRFGRANITPYERCHAAELHCRPRTLDYSQTFYERRCHAAKLYNQHREYQQF
jgi:hypothetical protein